MPRVWACIPSRPNGWYLEEYCSWSHIPTLYCRWDVMLACWDTTQENRPHFSQLTEMLSDIQLRADKEDVGCVPLDYTY